MKLLLLPPNMTVFLQLQDIYMFGRMRAVWKTFFQHVRARVAKTTPAKVQRFLRITLAAFVYKTVWEMGFHPATYARRLGILPLEDGETLRVPHVELVGGVDEQTIQKYRAVAAEELARREAALQEKHAREDNERRSKARVRVLVTKEMERERAREWKEIYRGLLRDADISTLAPTKAERGPRVGQLALINRTMRNRLDEFVAACAFLPPATRRGNGDVLSDFIGAAATRCAAEEGTRGDVLRQMLQGWRKRQAEAADRAVMVTMSRRAKMSKAARMKAARARKRQATTLLTRRLRTKKAGMAAGQRRRARIAFAMAAAARRRRAAGGRQGTKHRRAAGGKHH